jgi:phospholipid/cholesterol/gamma-HCH transport system substrate-binding protein
VRRRRQPNYFALGIATIVLIAVAVYAAWAKQVPFVNKYEIHGVFSSSNQLIKGSPVRTAGVEVGRVTGISNGPGTTTIVTMQIKDSGRPIHRDATLRIRPRVFLEGGFVVELDPGTPRAPALDDGATIPLPQTKVPVQLDQILARLDIPTREGLRSSIREVATALDGGGAEGLRHAIPPLAPTLRDVALISDAGRGIEPHELSRLIRSSARVTGAVADRDQQLADLVTQANRTTAAVASQSTSLSAGIAQLDALLREAPATLDAIDSSLPPLIRFTDAMRPTAAIAPITVRRLRALDAQLRAINRSPGKPSDQARLLILLRPLLRDVPKFSLLARGFFPLIGPISTCVRDQVMPTLSSKVDDGSLSTGRPVWQDFLHATVGLSGAAQSFDANGPWQRYLGSLGTQLVSTGSLPGEGQLFGNTREPIAGARPVWLGNGRRPPFRPDAPCTEQKPPDLGARAATSTITRRSAGRRPDLSARAAVRALLHPQQGRSR